MKLLFVLNGKNHLERTALESSSVGCATIISNRGGLTETCLHKVVLKDYDENELFKEINKLIINKNLRKQLQKKLLTTYLI